MGTSKRTEEDLMWAEKLYTENNSQSENKPSGEGWRTMKEIIEMSEFGQNKTRSIVNNAVVKGKMEAYNGSQESVLGRLVRQRWYRWV